MLTITNMIIMVDRCSGHPGTSLESHLSVILDTVLVAVSPGPLCLAKQDISASGCMVSWERSSWSSPGKSKPCQKNHQEVEAPGLWDHWLSQQSKHGNILAIMCWGSPRMRQQNGVELREAETYGQAKMTFYRKGGKPEFITNTFSLRKVTNVRVSSGTKQKLERRF